MPLDANALRDIHQANLDLGMKVTNLWLENLNRARGLALKAAEERVTSTHKTVAAIGAAKDLTTLVPLQAELMREQMAQAGNFWQSFLTESQSNQQAVLDDFHAAVQGWQTRCAKTLERASNTAPLADVCQQIAGAAGLAYQPLSAATQQMFDLARATFDSLQPKVPPATKARTA